MQLFCEYFAEQCLDVNDPEKGVLSRNEFFYRFFVSFFRILQT